MDVLSRFVTEASHKYRLHAKFLQAAVLELSPAEIAEFEDYFNYCLQRGFTMDYLVECYLTIVQDTYAEQIHFMKTGRYRSSSFAEVEKRVYGNPAYMEKYMLGLALTSFLWPNHRRISRYFLEQIPKERNGTYLEVGPGHGYYFLKALTGTSFDSFTAIDVSAKSIELTRQIVQHFAPNRLIDTDFKCQDFLESDLQLASYDAIVMGEVLEHIERPAIFMKRLMELSKPGGFVFMTTCVNAPAIDHISLFRTTGEVEKLCTDAGFVIHSKLDVPYFGSTLEDCVRQNLAINVAYNLVRSH